MEIPGGSQGSFQFRTTCFISVPLSFLFLLSPRGGCRCHRRVEEESKPLHLAESPKDQVWRDGGAGKRTRQGMGRWAAMWDGAEERAKSREQQGLCGSWRTGMIFDQAHRHSWMLKTRATYALDSSWGQKQPRFPGLTEGLGIEASRNLGHWVPTSTDCKATEYSYIHLTHSGEPGPCLMNSSAVES